MLPPSPSARTVAGLTDRAEMHCTSICLEGGCGQPPSKVFSIRQTVPNPCC